MTVVDRWQLTGKKSYRNGWRSCLVLTVQEARRIGTMTPNGPEWGNHEETRWRDARIADLVELADDNSRCAL